MYKKMVMAFRVALLFMLAAVILPAGMMEFYKPDRSMADISFSAETVNAEPNAVISERPGPKLANGANAITAPGPVAVAVAASAVPPKKHSVKTVYLTFDDGPSGLTGEVLDILKKADVKATFFILGQQADTRPELIGRMHEEGHAIGNHTYNHDYGKLYQKFTEFWRQIKLTEETVRRITGERPQLVRAPGGTAGNFDAAYFDLMKQGGYKVFDWNVDSGDSKKRGVPAAEILKGATTPIDGNQTIVLLHDGAGHQETVKALPGIITFYKKKGYRFDVLTPEIKPVQFKLQNRVKPKTAQPGARWIAENVSVNAALFQKGRTLSVEMGGLATEFAPGEYRMEEGKLLVPLRAAVERLGGSVNWKGDTKTVKVTLAHSGWIADPIKGTMTSTDGRNNLVTPEVRFMGHTVWVPLRETLELSGHRLEPIVLKDNVYKIVAL
ncbi:polysaccharide deacetylase [Paenibacillus sp. DMB20]|uniref:polysaccharide deacetylase n=1 Tax=Paenibacillus sp. DMB20 TaxID=1642570 RepID=UPI000AB6F659|nr:polysaccharide deacetylase [Paenibacillus sp. DMB20]